MIELSSDPAFAVSGDLRVLSWNAAAQRLTGLAAADVVGRRCADALRAEMPGGEPLCGPACHGGACFSKGIPFSVQESLVRHRDGHQVLIGLSTMIVPEAIDGASHRRTRAFVFLHELDGDACTAVMPQRLRVYALGQFGLVLNGRPVAVATWERKSALTLLKLLAMRPGLVLHRDRLIEYLWPGVDEGHGRSRLKVAAYSLRRNLSMGGCGSDLIKHVNEGYAVQRDAVWVDTAAFERLIGEGVVHSRHGRAAEAIACYQNAIEIYRGDYLEQDAYDDWCAEERERLREVFFDLAMRLSDALVQQERYEEAAQACRRALAFEPCREGLHRTLMECLIHMGRLAEAELQYRRCRQALARDLGVEPLRETRHLYHRIRAARATGS
ncbi:MAG: BTAD domain-containing putative transcriptional regulator [Methylibium sp.]